MKQREEDLRRARVERQERLKDLEEQYDDCMKTIMSPFLQLLEDLSNPSHWSADQ